MKHMLTHAKWKIDMHFKGALNGKDQFLHTHTPQTKTSISDFTYDCTFPHTHLCFYVPDVI